jgi:hypothetical protein
MVSVAAIAATDRDFIVVIIFASFVSGTAQVRSSLFDVQEPNCRSPAAMCWWSRFGGLRADAGALLRSSARNISSAVVRVVDEDRAAGRFAAAPAAGFDRLRLESAGADSAARRRVRSRPLHAAALGRMQDTDDSPDFAVTRPRDAGGVTAAIILIIAPDVASAAIAARLRAPESVPIGLVVRAASILQFILRSGSEIAQVDMLGNGRTRG